MSIISKKNNRITLKSSEIIGNYFLKGLLEHPVQRRDENELHWIQGKNSSKKNRKKVKQNTKKITVCSCCQRTEHQPALVIL
jgi:hypothetical protein